MLSLNRTEGTNVNKDNFFNLKNVKKKNKDSYPIIQLPKTTPTMKIISANMKLTTNKPKLKK